MRADVSTGLVVGLLLLLVVVSLTHSEDELRHAIVPRVQRGLLTLGAGNEQVYPGREDWLFYEADIAHLTDGGFLAEDVSPDAESDAGPVGAILDLQQQLAAHDIALMVVPVPVKPAVYPEKLSRRYRQRSESLRNPSFSTFVKQLRHGGVEVVDLMPTFEIMKRQGQPVFLATDTHWTPAAVQAAAAEIAAQAERLYPRMATAAEPSPLAPGLHLTHLGDTARMLSLPESRPLYSLETVVIYPVSRLRPSQWLGHAAPILLIGDSFANIYSFAAMGWGTGAGLVEHLSREFGVAVDRIVRNDGGALASRVELARRLTRNRGTLAGKHLVIYEFAERELSRGDWRRVAWPTTSSENPDPP